MSNIQINPYNFAAAGGVGGWVELGRTTLGSAGDTISVGSLPDKLYLMFLCYNTATGGDAIQRVQLNSDTANNYARRNDWNGGGDSTAVNQAYMTQNNYSLTLPTFSVGYLSNISTKEKLMISSSNGQNTVGAGTAPNRSESVGKWANTSNAISEVTIYNSEGGSFDTGSELVVLGYDPTDTHTSGGFWEELASVDLSGGAATNIDSGTITAKKYLWFQFYGDAITSSNSIRVTFNGDTGSNYADRSSQNGGAEDVNVNTANMQMTLSTHTTPSFITCFAINNSANEKLVTNYSIDQNTGGDGTAPTRVEGVHKWSCEPCQITSINFKTSGGANLGTNTKLKVWGSN
tara:strand:- start:559 stop:1599 length:1041 start_codon:yes stop_codon:yes gene_type:complete